MHRKVRVLAKALAAVAEGAGPTELGSAFSRYTGAESLPQGIGAMTITRIKLENFTVFESLDLEPSPGINVLVGANGTGKTHLMKVCYAAYAFGDDSDSSPVFETPPPLKLLRVFRPSGNSYGRLVNGTSNSDIATLEINVNDSYVKIQVSKISPPARARGSVDWLVSSGDAVYIPAKDMLANAPGFRSLYARREIHFDETFKDILDLAYLDPLRNPSEFVSPNVLDRLEAELGGKVTIHGEEFFLSNEQGEIEFTLLAEGHRKLGLLWLLIRNGSLKPGAVLFWDEPETNLNPKLYGVVIDVLLELQRVGVQVFLATHDYVILKELDLQAKEGDKVAFHSLYRSPDTGQIECRTSDRYSGIQPNAIADTFSYIYDRDILRAVEGIV